MNSGARRPPAVTGSITIDNSGMPTMENPPPNAPFMKQIRNTPAKATRIVVPSAPARPGRRSSHPRPVRSSHEAVDRSLDLGMREADVPECASSSSRRCATAARRAKWRVILFQEAVTVRRPAPVLDAPAGWMMVERVADMSDLQCLLRSNARYNRVDAGRMLLYDISAIRTLISVQ